MPNMLKLNDELERRYALRVWLHDHTAVNYNL